MTASTQSHSFEATHTFVPYINVDQQRHVTGPDGLLRHGWVEMTTRTLYDRLREGKASWEGSLAWKGACWCSDEPLGSFPYGPGPGDAYLPVSLLRRFFGALERMDVEDAEQTMRFAYVLALLEAIVHVGLDESGQNPLFTRGVFRVEEMLDLAPESMVRRMLQETGAASHGNMIQLRPAAEENTPRLDTRAMADSLFSLLDDDRPSVSQAGA